MEHPLREIRHQVKNPLIHFLNDAVSVNGGVAYTTLSAENDDTGEGADVSGLTFGFGLSVYFGK